MRELGAKSVLMAGYARRPIEAGGVPPRHVRPRQRPRLRPALGEVRRARRRARGAQRAAAAPRHPVDLELRVQPRQRTRRGARVAVQVAVPRRRDPPVPGAAHRVPRGRRGVGVRAVLVARRSLGEAQPRRDRRARSRPPRRRRAARATSPSTATTRSPARIDELRDVLRRARRRARRRSTSSRPSASTRPTTCATRFEPNFYFGCEADDPLVAWAFRDDVNPLGARLRPVLGSDISHWDVRDMTEPVAEAYELVEHGVITERDFRDLTFVNPVRLHAGAEPAVLRGHGAAKPRPPRRWPRPGRCGCEPRRRPPAALGGVRTRRRRRCVGRDARVGRRLDGRRPRGAADAVPGVGARAWAQGGA